MATTQQTIECRYTKCHNHFVPKNAQHSFCSEKCRRSARGNQWRIIREAAVIRDHETCQDCKATKCRLEVHHILPLYLGGDNKLANLITLCKCCHRKRHRTWKPAVLGRPVNGDGERATEQRKAIRPNKEDYGNQAA